MAQKDGLDHLAKLDQRRVGRMLSCALPEPPQNRLCVCRANAKRRCIFDQFVILLGNDAPVNRVFGEHRLEVWIAIEVPGKRAIELLARDGLESREQLKAQEITKGKGHDTLAVTVAVLAVNLHFGTVAQHALNHRGNFGRGATLDLRINTRRLAVHMPVDHNAWPPVADMPLSQQVLVPSTELFRV